MHRREYNSVLIEKMLQEEEYPQRHSYYHQQQNAAQHNDQSQLQLRMVVDIGDGRKDSIQITRDDDPSLLARKFCYEHNLDPKVIAVLSKNIRTFMQSTYNNPIVSSLASDNTEQNKQNLNSSKLPTSSSKASLSKSRAKGRESANNSSMTQSSQHGSRYMVPGNSSVFDRLYNSRRKQRVNTSNVNSNASKSNILGVSSVMMDSQNSLQLANVPVLNSGVMIYQRNRRLNEASKRKAEKKVNEQRQEKSIEYTFQPCINQISRLMVQKIRELAPQESIQQRNSRLKQDKLIQLKSDKEKKEIQGCTFHPRTNHSSVHMSRDPQYRRSGSTDRFMDLYHDSVERVTKSRRALQAVNKQHSFHPSINPISNILTSDSSFTDRLKKYQTDRQVRAVKTKREVEEAEMLHCSSRRNQRNFHPEVGRAPQNRNKQGLPVGVYLYNGRHDKQKAILRVLEEEQRELRQRGSATNLNSSKIYESCKAESIANLFKMLDSDGDGLISTRRVNLADTGNQLLKIIAPILNQMQQLEVQLGQSDFAEAMHHLFKTLSVHEKNLVLRHAQNHSIESECSFRPSLNQKSLQIAKTKRGDSSRPGVGLYEICQAKQSQKELAIQKQQELLQLAQMQECTFQPRTKRKRPRN